MTARLLYLTVAFVLSTNVISSKPESAFRIEVPPGNCKPCQLFSGSKVNRRCSADPTEHRVLKNDTFEAVNELFRQDLLPIVRELAAEAANLRNAFDTGDEFYPYRIKELENIEESNVSKHLKAGNPVERILHNAYGRTVLLRAYLKLYQTIIHDGDNLTKVARSSQVTFIIRKLDHLLCKLYEYTYMFNVRKINKKTCRYSRVEQFDESSKRDFLLAVIADGSKSFNTTLDDMQSLESAAVHDVCKYECKDNKRTLSCGEEKKQLRLKKGKGRGKNKGKGKGRNKDKGRRRDRKRKNRQRKNKNRRHKNKKNRRNKGKEGSKRRE